MHCVCLALLVEADVPGIQSPQCVSPWSPLLRLIMFQTMALHATFKVLHFQLHQIYHVPGFSQILSERAVNLLVMQIARKDSRLLSDGNEAFALTAAIMQDATLQLI